tara:strand:- start:9804 stop:10043 length:240 start_codon:yes stop_codon:yes gene_type:complete
MYVILIHRNFKESNALIVVVVVLKEDNEDRRITMSVCPNRISVAKNEAKTRVGAVIMRANRHIHLHPYNHFSGSINQKR